MTSQLPVCLSVLLSLAAGPVSQTWPRVAGCLPCPFRCSRTGTGTRSRGDWFRFSFRRVSVATRAYTACCLLSRIMCVDGCICRRKGVDGWTRRARRRCSPVWSAAGCARPPSSNYNLPPLLPSPFSPRKSMVRPVGRPKLRPAGTSPAGAGGSGAWQCKGADSSGGCISTYLGKVGHQAHLGFCS